jgi:hypothetical protein
MGGLSVAHIDNDLGFHGRGVWLCAPDTRSHTGMDVPSYVGIGELGFVVVGIRGRITMRPYLIFALSCTILAPYGIESRGR